MKKIKHYFAYLIFIGIIIIITFYSFVIVTDIRIPHLNPPDEEKFMPIPIDLYLRDITGTPDIEICLFVHYEGVLVAGKGVTLTAIGYINNPEATNITHINIGLKLMESYPYQTDDRGMPIKPILKIINDGTGKLTGDSIEVYWTNPGDYYPTIVIYTNDMMYPHEASTNVINIASESTLLAEKYNRINMGLSIAFFYFAFIGAIYLCLEIFKKDKSRKK